MNAQDCPRLLRAMRDAAFATVDARGNPRCRILNVRPAEEGTPPHGAHRAEGLPC